MTPEPFTVSPGMMLPELLRAHPGLRVVFDRYGLRGCGGPFGPAESVAYFARAHGVDERALVAELNAALRDPEAARVAASDHAPGASAQLADTIYRRFFKAALVVVMTAGATWGALLLLRIGALGSFTALSIHDVNAHGHAQIFGWVGLFVMGFAYQAFPRIKHTNLWRPSLANLTFYLMVFGVFARAIGEPLFAQPAFRGLAVAANAAEIVAIGLFAAVIVTTIRASGKPLERFDGYVLASIAFFFVQAVYDLALLYGTTAGGLAYERVLHLVSVYQGPLRDLQIHGFALLMILGVGLRMFPALFGFRAARAESVKVGLVLLVAAVVGEAVFFILMRRIGGAGTIAGLYGSMLLLAFTSVALTWRWGLLAKPTEADRSIKFVRAATVWLHLSMMMLVLLPVYVHAVLPAAGALSSSGARSVEIGFSHAYGGAVRHAITVGFISLMILGMAAKVAPTLNGVDIRQLRALWGPFVLVNVGCGMRVTFQIATDFAEWAYPVAGVSGLLELTGIAIWGVHLWRIMSGWAPAAVYARHRPERISADDKVGHVVEWFPETLAVFLRAGFTPLANPIMRRTVARAVSVRQAAAQHGLELQPLLDALNEVARAGRAVRPSGLPGSTIALPVLSDAR